MGPAAGCSMVSKCEVIDTGSTYQYAKLFYDPDINKLVMIKKPVKSLGDGTIIMGDPSFDMTVSEIFIPASIVTIPVSTQSIPRGKNEDLRYVGDGCFMAYVDSFDTVITRYQGWTTGKIFPFKRYTVNLANWTGGEYLPNQTGYG